MSSLKMIVIIEKLNSLDDRTTLTPASPWRLTESGIGDLVLDLLRAAAHPVGEDDHLVLGQVGDRVDRHRQHGADARDAERERGQDHEEAVADRPLDDRLRSWSVLRSAQCRWALGSATAVGLGAASRRLGRAATAGACRCGVPG